MSILAQHGSQKGNKIIRGLTEGVIGGAIFSPKSETPDNLESTILELRSSFANSTLLVDPQFYLNLLPDLEAGKFDRYDKSLHFHPVSRRDLSNPRKLQSFVKAIIDYQARLPLSAITAPGILIDDFQDKSSQINISLMEESQEYYSSLAETRPLVFALNIAETAFNSDDDVNEFLDILTGMDNTSGFYIVINSSDTDRAWQNIPALERFLYFIYALTVLNGFRVTVGYTNSLGLLLQAVGASDIGIGWFKKQQGFSISHYVTSERTGGRQAIPRYYSIPLLDSIKVVPTLSSIIASGAVGEIASNTQYDLDLLRNPTPEDWSPEKRILHLWEAIGFVTTRILGVNDIGQRLNILSRSIDEANALYLRLFSRGVQFDISSPPLHLRQWSEAISIFRARVRL